MQRVKVNYFFAPLLFVFHAYLLGMVKPSNARFK